MITKKGLRASLRALRAMAPTTVRSKQIPSVSRTHFHLQNRNLLLNEAYALPCPLDP